MYVILYVNARQLRTNRPTVSHHTGGGIILSPNRPVRINSIVATKITFQTSQIFPEKPRSWRIRVAVPRFGVAFSPPSPSPTSPLDRLDDLLSSLGRSCTLFASVLSSGALSLPILDTLINVLFNGSWLPTTRASPSWSRLGHPKPKHAHQ